MKNRTVENILQYVLGIRPKGYIQENNDRHASFRPASLDEAIRYRILDEYIELNGDEGLENIYGLAVFEGQTETSRYVGSHLSPQQKRKVQFQVALVRGMGPK